ncbi:MAG: DUF512 domain-containing protein [Bacillota bacterium]
MIDIIKVQPESIAEEMNIEAGDKLIEINGQAIRDYIDFQYMTSDDFFTLLVKKADGQVWELEIERQAGEILGIELNGIIYDNLKLCRNNCLFCFIKQQAKEVRDTLLLKDDDYRFSFLQGSFITLSNLNKDDFKRIINLNLSPLYISVHTTNPELRVKMMKNKQAALIKEQLELLAKNNIFFHTQIVLCPGINDGKELDRTIKDLLEFYPSVLSIGVVPVGLTKHRDNLPELKSFTPEDAKKTLSQIENWQKFIKNNKGDNILYASDEFYLLSEKELPVYQEYNGFPQIENGIGLTRLLRENFENNFIDQKYKLNSFGIITAVLGEKAIKPIIKKLESIDKINIDLITVKNTFYGENVTVTGLLTATDIISAIKKRKNIPKDIFLPSVILNKDQYFLDNYTFEEFKDIFPGIDFYLVEDFSEILEVLKNG